MLLVLHTKHVCKPAVQVQQVQYDDHFLGGKETSYGISYTLCDTQMAGRLC